MLIGYPRVSTQVGELHKQGVQFKSLTDDAIDTHVYRTNYINGGRYGRWIRIIGRETLPPNTMTRLDDVPLGPITSATDIRAEPGDHVDSRPDLARLLRCTYNVGVSELRFQWDARKNASNKRKHGISFEEARTVFTDEHALLIDDPDHSEDEARFVLLGLSSALRLLVVCHCYREEGDSIRIISARRADSSERANYTERWKP